MMAVTFNQWSNRSEVRQSIKNGFVSCTNDLKATIICILLNFAYAIRIYTNFISSRLTKSSHITPLACFILFLIYAKQSERATKDFCHLITNLFAALIANLNANLNANLTKLNTSCQASLYCIINFVTKTFFGTYAIRSPRLFLSSQLNQRLISPSQ